MSLAALGLLLAPPALAQSPKDVARITYVPANSNPPLPPGLKVVCVKIPDSGAARSSTCPVVTYRGIVTWAYSFLDNRPALALVSYDAQNKIVRNVSKNGLRYVFDATSSLHNKTVTFVGQAKNWTTVPWSELGPPGQ